MLTSISLIFLCGLLLGGFFKLLRLPSLIGMIITGMVLGPHMLNLLDDSIMSISYDLRQIALVIILTRAGLSLNIADLKKVGRPAVLMCFVPACFEIVGAVLLAPRFLNVTVAEAALMGSVIAAVSPAVIVPRMIKLIEEGYGKEHSIPQLILAGASVDDVFVIVMFTAFSGLVAGNRAISAVSFVQVPISIVLGIVTGSLLGLILIFFFKKVHIRDSVKLIIIISLSFLLLQMQDSLEGVVPFSGLIAIMSVGIILKQRYDVLAIRLSGKYNKLWVAAEIMLFVLVGATVDLNYAVSEGAMAIVLVLGTLIFRMAGVLCCLIKTQLTLKERLFCMLAYIPKATVQASIGAIPLTMGLFCGDMVLTVAVLSILITAPMGAICVDLLHDKLLEKNKPMEENNYGI